MNNATLLGMALHCQPDDKTIALVMADALMEEYGVTRSQALRRVARVRRSALRSKWVKEATELLRTPHTLREAIHRAIRRECNLEIVDQFEVMVVPSLMWPKVFATSQLRRNRFWSNSTVLVGARWIINTARAITTANGVQFARPKLSRFRG